MTYTLTRSSLILLTAINIFNYLDRYLLNAILPIIISEFSLSDFQGGQLISAFVLGYVLFSPIFGYLGDKYPRPLLMFVGILTWAIATLSSAFAFGFFTFAVARIFVGIGEASYATIAPGYIKDLVQDPLKLNKTLSIFFAAIPVGSALGFVLGGIVSKYSSWHYAFIYGAIPVIFMSIFLLQFPEFKRNMGANESIIKNIKDIFQIKILRFTISGYILNTFALTGVAAFISKYGMTLGFSLSEINNYFGIILCVTGFTGTLAGGKISNYFAAKHSNPSLGMLSFVSLSSALAVPFLAATFLVHDKFTFLSFCAISEFLIFAAIAPVNTIIVLQSPKSLVTRTQGITILMINIFGTFLAPQVVGKLSDVQSLSIGLQITTIAMFFSSFTWAMGSLYLPMKPK